MMRQTNSFLMLSEATESVTITRQKEGSPPGTMEQVAVDVALNPKMEISMFIRYIFIV